jgi:hypothetical protein
MAQQEEGIRGKEEEGTGGVREETSEREGRLRKKKGRTKETGRGEKAEG